MSVENRLQTISPDGGLEEHCQRKQYPRTPKKQYPHGNHDKADTWDTQEGTITNIKTDHCISTRAIQESTRSVIREGTNANGKNKWNVEEHTTQPRHKTCNCTVLILQGDTSTTIKTDKWTDQENAGAHIKTDAWDTQESTDTYNKTDHSTNKTPGGGAKHSFPELVVCSLGVVVAER